MDNECLDLLIASGKHGDRHYRGMREWLLTRLSDRSRTKCLRLALAYRDSLDELLDCLKRQKPSRMVKLRTQHTREFLELLDKDITILSNHTAKFPIEPAREV
jgi:hypothetical protein